MTRPVDAVVEKLRYFLLDMDGTIYMGANPIPGAAEFIQALRDTDRKFLFFTNNPTKDAAQYSEKLSAMGIDAEPEDILTSGAATARYLMKATAYRRAFVLGNDSFEAELTRAGMTVVDENPDVVVLAFDTTLTYEKLRRASRFLLDDVPYIATNPDLVCPTPDGPIPDCGSMAALLEKATGRTPKYIGKPNAEMAQMGMDKLGADPAHTAMVGDRLYTDMAMAHQTGITSILVLSGEATREDVKAIDTPPDVVVDSVADLIHVLH